MKKLGILERKVDKNDQIIRDKISSLDNRFMELETHVLYLLSKSPCNLSHHPSNVLDDHFKSPPVPALERKLEEAEWERSFSLDREREKKMAKVTKFVDEDEHPMNSTEDMEEFKSQLKSQREMIDQLLERDRKRDEQVTSLLVSIKVPENTLTQSQLELSALQGRMLDMNGRIDNIEETQDVGEASMMIPRTSPSPSV
ncbi:hypothetical protein V865_007895 [Kwoniella europaea PYCC6329]|uniref:Uncharacterized protein n=1 Tax=Kwoniella europaea PYCC6329 TaxID=1423913 RepID=A0AAX4KTM5_9TREE